MLVSLLSGPKKWWIIRILSFLPVHACLLHGLCMSIRHFLTFGSIYLYILDFYPHEFSPCFCNCLLVSYYKGQTKWRFIRIFKLFSSPRMFAGLRMWIRHFLTFSIYLYILDNLWWWWWWWCPKRWWLWACVFCPQLSSLSPLPRVRHNTGCAETLLCNYFVAYLVCDPWYERKPTS